MIQYHNTKFKTYNQNSKKRNFLFKLQPTLKTFFILKRINYTKLSQMPLNVNSFLNLNHYPHHNINISKNYKAFFKKKSLNWHLPRKRYGKLNINFNRLENTNNQNTIYGSSAFKLFIILIVFFKAKTVYNNNYYFYPYYCNNAVNLIIRPVFYVNNKNLLLFNPKTLLNYNNKTYTKDITTAHNHSHINNTRYLVPKLGGQHNKVTLSTKVSPFKLLNPFLSKSLPNWFFTQRFKKLLPTNSLFLHNIHYSDYYNAFKTVFLSNSLTDKYVNSVYSLLVKPLHLSDNFPQSYKHRMRSFYVVYSKFLDNQDRINKFSKNLLIWK